MMMRKRFVYLLGFAVLLAVLLAACGGGSKRPTSVGLKHVPAATVAKRCPASGGYMGCSVGVVHLGTTQAPPKAKLRPIKLPRGCIIPDVSNWQGHPNWLMAKPHICGGIYKAGEGSNVRDPDAAFNEASLRSLGLWHAAYWFVRPGSCVADAQAFLAMLAVLGYAHDPLAGPPVADDEVPGTQGYVACMDRVMYPVLHVHLVVYTAPGTWPGGSAGVTYAWPAAYGPQNPPCLPFTCSHYVAWQFAAPPFVNYFVPGLGDQDESINFTFTSMRPFAKPTPAPCSASAKSMPAHCLALFAPAHFGQRLTERQAATDYKYRAKAVAASDLHGQLVAFEKRLWFVAHHTLKHGTWEPRKTADWTEHRGFRFGRLLRDAQGR